MTINRSESGIAVTGVLAIVAALAGLVIGPGQIVWCMFLSGEKVAEYELQPDKSVVVPLSPDQNPLRFLARIEYREPYSHFGRAETAFDGELRSGDEEVWSSRFSVSHTDDDDDGARIVLVSSYTTSAVKLFSVEEAGDYTFVAKSTSDNDIDVRGITLKVRKNVSAVHTMSAVVGFLLLIAAFVFAFMAARARSAAEPDVGSESSEGKEPSEEVSS